MIRTPEVRRSTPAVAALAFLLLTACGPTTKADPPPPPAAPITLGALSTLAIVSDASTVAVDGTVQFGAIGLDGAGHVLALTPTWSVIAGGGTIDGAGLFKAGTAAGSFSNSVKVAAEGLSATGSITVTAGALATVSLTPDPAVVAAKSTVLFRAVGQDSYGNDISIAPTWSVVAGGGTVTAAGAFTAGRLVGTFTNTVKASQGRAMGYASVSVIPGVLASITLTPVTANLAVKTSQQFTATGRDADGNAVPVSPAWSSVRGGTISATGLFTAGTLAGWFPDSITAASGSIEATASVTLVPGPLARLTLTPTIVTLPVGAVQQFYAMGRDAYGNVIAVTPTWSVVANGGTITPAGVFTAGRSAGTFTDTVKVTSGGFSDWVSITVTPNALAIITVTPTLVAMAANTTQLFSAFGTDALGNGVSISPIWSAGPGGAIDASGLYTAGPTAGTFTNAVTASAGGLLGRASVTVTAGPLANMVITRSPVTLATNTPFQFAVTGTDASGNPVSLTPVWSVVAGGGAIDGLGMFTSGTVAGTFTNTIRATSGAVSADATVTITAGPLATLTVVPASATLSIGATQQFTATGKDADGNNVALSPSWNVLAGGGAITPAGLFTAGTVAGTFNATVLGTSGAISGTGTVTVTPGALASIAVTGNTPSMLVSTTRQLTATGTDSHGNVVPMTPAWSVVAGGGAVSTSGLFSAGTAAGIFTDTILAASGGISGTATMTLTVAVPPPNAIALGAASTFSVLAGTAVTNSGASALIGDVGLDPGGPTSVTGFPPGNITGTLHVNDALAVQAQTDLTSAFLAAQGKVCPTGHDESGIDLGASPFAAGVWCFAAGAGLTGTITLNGGGDPSAVFIFQVASALTTATSSTYLLQNGAQAKNVFWVVGSSATLGVNSALPGTILALTDITLTNGATLLGRALARNGTVVLAANAVTVP